MHEHPALRDLQVYDVKIPGRACNKSRREWQVRQTGILKTECYPLKQHPGHETTPSFLAWHL